MPEDDLDFGVFEAECQACASLASVDDLGSRQSTRGDSAIPNRWLGTAKCMSTNVNSAVRPGSCSRERNERKRTGSRRGYTNGYTPKALSTRAGQFMVDVPKARSRPPPLAGAFCIASATALPIGLGRPRFGLRHCRRRTVPSAG